MAVSTNAASFFCMAWKDVSWSAWMVPVNRPESCCGKKPFGTFAYRKIVAAMVARVTMSVNGWCFRTHPSDRSYPCRTVLKAFSLAW